VHKTLDFADLLQLIDERSTAFQAAIAAAPSLDVPVPTCPGWKLTDLVQHLRDGRHRWATIVAAGPGAAPPPKPTPAATPADAEAGAPADAEAGTRADAKAGTPADAKAATPADTKAGAAADERDAALAALAASTRELLDALREAGPDRGCWTWWDRSESPDTSGAVARHQLQEMAVHTYDAQVALGAPQPLPDEIALDGVDEFLSTCCAGAYSWPYTPVTVHYQVADGPTWHLSLAADGVRKTRLTTTPSAPADVSAEGTASDLVLALYARIPMDSLKVDGDARIFDQLFAWNPDA